MQEIHIFDNAGVQLGLGEEVGSACQVVLRSTCDMLDSRETAMLLVVANHNTFGISYGFKAKVVIYDDFKKVGAS
jgi:hypothetical protein